MAEVTYEDFAKLDLRVGKIEAAEPVQGAQKLFKLTVDLGSEKRILVAGIANGYAPEECVGKKIIVIANMAPKNFAKFGLVSAGMLLAADDAGRTVLVTVEKDVALGTKIY